MVLPRQTTQQFIQKDRVIEDDLHSLVYCSELMQANPDSGIAGQKPKCARQVHRCQKQLHQLNA